MVRLLHDRATAAYPIIIHSLGFSKVADVVAAGFILALTMPPTPEITKVWLLIEAKPPVSSRAAPAPHRLRPAFTASRHRRPARPRPRRRMFRPQRIPPHRSRPFPRCRRFGAPPSSSSRRRPSEGRDRFRDGTGLHRCDMKFGCAAASPQPVERRGVVVGQFLAHFGGEVAHLAFDCGL
jgi:hypothetical protein